MVIRLIMIWILNILDMSITMYGLSNYSDYLYEANRLMSKVVYNTPLFILIKVGYIGFICLLVYWLYKYSGKAWVKKIMAISSWFLLIEYVVVVGVITWMVIDCSLL